LQYEYRAWLDNLPASLEGSRLADKLQAVAELDLEEELHAIDPPHHPITGTMVKLLNLTHTTSPE
jgi:hypothetical protein